MTETVARLSRKLDENEAKVRRHEQRYAGDSPLSYLSPDARAALGDRLKVLNINFCRLAVDALAERIKVAGFSIDGKHDENLWSRWRDLNMQDGAAQAVTDALATGRGFISVWANEEGPTASPESPAQCIVERDPVTRQITVALKRWVDDGHGYAVLYEPWRVTTYRSLAGVPEGGMIPADGWTVIDSRPNPLGVVPLIQLTNRGRTSDVHGVSEMDPIKDLNDALVKVATDALVTSEHYARPRRWSTGLEIVEDGDGNAVDPFTDKMKLWQSEDPDTKFGQFAQSDLSSYTDLSGTLLSQIGALSGLPAHYLFSDMQPTSGEEVRAKEVSLVARAESKLISFGLPMAQVARLMVAARDNRPVKSIRAETIWADAGTRTVAQDADAIVKLHAEGLVSTEAALSKIGWSPEQIEDDKAARLQEAALKMAAGL